MDFEPLKYIPEPKHYDLLPKPSLWERFVEFLKKFRLPKVPKLPKVPEVLKFKVKLVPFFVVLLFFVFVYLAFISAPANFPEQNVLAVEKGETLSGISAFLKNNGMIRSELVFKVSMIAFGGTRGLVAGDYFLKEKQNGVYLAWRLSNGDYHLENIRITIPEGFSVREIAQQFVKSGSFPRFDQDEFQKLASPYEGYLFPDTYLFLPSVDAKQVVVVMNENFKKRIASISDKITTFGRSESDVIKMASIIEREARTEESRKIIAGILWKRLDEGMPLQVDAAFLMVNGKTDSADLTLDDLKIQSPYNTYVNKGLPPGPIANPGLDSILATISPTKTKYYFYLSDSKGNMHYGVTHEDHLVNKQKYIW